MSQIRATIGAKRLLSHQRAAKILADAGKYGQMQLVRENILRITEEFVPSVFDGNILLFTTTLNPLSRLSSSWDRYVFGQIKVCTLYCHHSDMIEPEVMKIIADSVLVQLEDAMNQTSQAYPVSSTDRGSNGKRTSRS
jgi:hypothetical protein